MKKTLSFLVALCLIATAAVSCNNGSKGSDENNAELNETETADMAKDMEGFTLLSDRTNSDGVRKISVTPLGVCSQRIDIAVKDGIIESVVFTGGCPGNTQGVAKLVAGMKVTDAIAELEGIDCAGKGTSCPDRLAKALKLFL